MKYTTFEKLEQELASRDAEVVSLTNQRDYEYVRAENAEQERDQLREQVKLLREEFQTYIDEHEECEDADGWMAMLCSVEAHHVASEALAATIPVATMEMEEG